LAAVEGGPSQTADETSPRILPDRKSVRQSLASLWPGGTLTLVKRMPAPGPGSQPTSVFRLRKGDDAVLIFIDSASYGKISRLRTAPDREYDW
jgi:hypothetical protein